MTTLTTPPRRWLRFLHHPIVWTTLGIVAIFAATGALLAVGRALGGVGPSAAALTSAAAAVLLYLAFRRGLGGQATPELAVRGAGRELLLGILAGAGFIAASVGIIALFAGLTFTWGDNPASVVLRIISVSVGAAVVEELVFRGLLLQSISRAGGRWVALTITAVLFGAMHLLNPGATVWSAFAIAVQAGVLLGAAFFWRRSLWFPIGLHFGWNALQGLVGIPVSGVREPGLLLGTPHGPWWLSGGEFGVEGSVVPVAIGVLLSGLMIAATLTVDRSTRMAGARRGHVSPTKG